MAKIFGRTAKSKAMRLLTKLQYPILLAMSVCVCAGCIQEPSVKLAAQPARKRGPASAIMPKKLPSGAIIRSISIADAAWLELWYYYILHNKRAKFDEYDGLYYSAVSDWSDREVGKAIVVILQSDRKKFGFPLFVLKDSNQKILQSRKAVEVGTSSEESSGMSVWCTSQEGIPIQERGIDFTLGVASGSWKSVGVYFQAKGRFEHKSGSVLKFSILTDLVDKNIQLYTIVSDEPRDDGQHFYRYVLRYPDKAEEYHYIPFGQNDRPSEYFRGTQFDIQTIELQSREIEWQRYENVYLTPRKLASVR